MQWPNRYYFPGLVARLEAAFPALLEVLLRPVAECVCEYLSARTDDFMTAMYKIDYPNDHRVVFDTADRERVPSWHIAFGVNGKEEIDNLRYMNARIPGIPWDNNHVPIVSGWTTIQSIWNIAVGDTSPTDRCREQSFLRAFRHVEDMFYEWYIEKCKYPDGYRVFREEMTRAIWKYVDKCIGQRQMKENALRK
jgi:hypothetical protein